MSNERNETTHDGARVLAMAALRAQNRTEPDRDLTAEIRTWLTTYTGFNVSRRDAENLMGFLVATGWKTP